MRRHRLDFPCQRAVGNGPGRPSGHRRDGVILAMCRMPRARRTRSSQGARTASSGHHVRAWMVWPDGRVSCVVTSPFIGCLVAADSCYDFYLKVCQIEIVFWRCFVARRMVRNGRTGHLRPQRRRWTRLEARGWCLFVRLALGPTTTGSGQPPGYGGGIGMRSRGARRDRPGAGR